MSYSSIDLSENAQDNRHPVTNDFGLLYEIAIANYNQAIYLGLSSAIGKRDTLQNRVADERLRQQEAEEAKRCAEEETKIYNELEDELSFSTLLECEAEATEQSEQFLYPSIRDKHI